MQHIVIKRTPLALAIGLTLAAGTAMAQTQDMGTVVVTASGFEQNLIDAPASITVITAEQLRERRYNNLAQALGDVEGIDIHSTNGKTGGWDIRMRGMSSEYTLVLIDGRRQNTTSSTTPNGFGETSSSFMPPLSAIERIEIIRGPASTLYGSDAMGGAINIITKKTSGEWGGELTLDSTIQSDSDFGNTSNVSVFASGPLVENLLGLQLRGSMFSRNPSTLINPETDQPISKRGPSPVKSTVENFGARLSLTPMDGHFFTLDFDSSSQWYDNSEGQLGTVGPAGGYDTELEFNREQWSLSHQGRYSFGIWDSSITQTTTEKLGRLIPTSTGYPNAGEHRDVENTNLVFDTKLVTNFHFAGDHTFTVGGQYLDAEMREGVATDKFTQDTLSFFIEDEWRLTDTLALTAGLRYDDHSAFGGHVSPRAYLVWNTTDNLTLKGGISTGYKTPRLDQLHDGLVNLGGQGRSASIGSPDLQPETSTSYELAAYWQGNNGIDLSATLFFNQFEDKIATGNPLVNCEFDYAAYLATNPNNPIADPGVIDQNSCYSLGSGTFVTQYEFSQSTNVEKASTQGIELSARIPLDTFIPGAANWSLSANYTYTDSEAEDRDGKITGKLTDSPEHMANATLRWSATESLTAWLKAEYRGERRRFLGSYSDQNANNQLLLDAVGDYKAYTLLSLGGAYQVSESVTINASIDNLLNTDFLEYGSYENTANSTVYVQRYNLFQEPRRLWVGVNVTF